MRLIYEVQKYIGAHFVLNKVRYSVLLNDDTLDEQRTRYCYQI